MRPTPRPLPPETSHMRIMRPMLTPDGTLFEQGREFRISVVQQTPSTTVVDLEYGVRLFVPNEFAIFFSTP